MLEQVAARYEKRLVIVETNLRQVFDRVLPWGMTHGTALAAVGHFLSGEIERLIIPSSFGPKLLHPWGSHPALDPLWSSSLLEVEYDSCARTRMEKLHALVDEGTPLELLRVCWENPEQAYNCGICAKCFRTMAGLAAAGALHRAPVFPQRPNLAAAARLDLGDENDGLFLAEVLVELERTGREPELADFLRKIPVIKRSSKVPFSRLRQQNKERGEPLVIKAAKVEVSEDRTAVSVPVHWGELQTTLEVEFDLGGKAPQVVGDALLLWFILAAMRHKVPLVLEDPVSAELLKNIDHAQGLWSTDHSSAGHSRVDVRAVPAVAPETLPQRPWASAFSSGVDANFTGMTESSRIEYLVWIEGMDSDAFDPEENARTHHWMQEGAAALGKRLVTVRSNLRRVLFRELDLDYPFMYAMSPYGLAHLMQEHIGGMFIAADISYAEMFTPTAQTRYNPILDPWLGTRRVAIKVHGMTHDRCQKVAVISRRPELMEKLVVCQQRAIRGFAGGRNCGRCEKCQRTLIVIRMAGGQHPVEAFDQPLDVGRLRDVSEASTLVKSKLLFYQTMLRHLERQGNDPELLEVLSPIVRLAERKVGISPPGPTAFQALRNDLTWPKMLKAQAAEAAAAVVADKPSARLGALLDHPPSGKLGKELLNVLVQKDGRAKLLRRVLGRALRFDFGKGQAK